MDCPSISPLIEGYLDENLTPDEQAAVALHLADCAACRARADDFARLGAFLREMPREAVPLHLTARIKRQARAGSLQERLGHALPVALATFCSAVIFIWLAGETWTALQDRALLEFADWFVNAPEILWQYPGEVLTALAEFAPISRLLFTLGSALSLWLLAQRLVDELRRPQAA